MPEYIEKQKVLDMLDELSVVDPIWEAVKRIPAADVAPVRHGRWELSEDRRTHMVVCSVCRSRSRVCFDYCHSCGAKMDGEEAAT